MIKKIKLMLLSLSTLFAFAVPALGTAGVSAQLNQNTNINNNLCSGANGDFTGGSTSGCDTSAEQSANNLLKTVVNVISIIVGVIAVIMIIVAGLRYITSGGKDESVKGAKNTILYAIIGLVIVALAQIIVHFVLAKTTNATTQ